MKKQLHFYNKLPLINNFQLKPGFIYSNIYFPCTLMYAPAVAIAVVALLAISCIAACKLCLYQV